MIKDPVVEHVRKVSHKLIAKHGGLRGWILNLQELDRERARKRRMRAKRRKPSK